MSRLNSQKTARLVKGFIFDLQKFSIHDGPGIRTTVFVKGCPLRCLWCHNPESQERKAEISYLSEKCIQCGYCVRVCPEGRDDLGTSKAQEARSVVGHEKCHRIENGVHVFDRTRCTACGACTKECWSKALELIGREITVEDALSEVLKDRAFYQHSGGGLTISGGEPLMQFEFTRALLAAAKREGLHTVIETCGQAPWERYEALMPLVDLFYFDFKESDAARHKEYTGVDNGLILENLRGLSAAGAALVLRCPIIPGRSERPEHFEAIAALGRELKSLREIHLLPYHNLGSAKSERLGGAYPLGKIPLPEDAVIDGWIAAVKAGLARDGVQAGGGQGGPGDGCAVTVRRD